MLNSLLTHYEAPNEVLWFVEYKSAFLTFTLKDVCHIKERH